MSQQLEAQDSSNGIKIETCKALELRNRVIPKIPKLSDEEKDKVEGKKKSGKEVVVEKEVETNSEGEKLRRIVVKKAREK